MTCSSQSMCLHSLLCLLQTWTSKARSKSNRKAWLIGFQQLAWDVPRLASSVLKEILVELQIDQGICPYPEPILYRVGLLRSRQRTLIIFASTFPWTQPVVDLHRRSTLRVLYLLGWSLSGKRRLGWSRKESWLSWSTCCLLGASQSQKVCQVCFQKSHRWVIQIARTGNSGWQSLQPNIWWICLARLLTELDFARQSSIYRYKNLRQKDEDRQVYQWHTQYNTPYKHPTHLL